MMPAWLDRVNLGDVFHDDDTSLKEKTEAIRERMARFEEDISDLLDDLILAGEDDNVDEFDAAWNLIYDWADGARVWIDTLSTPTGGVR